MESRKLIFRKSCSADATSNQRVLESPGTSLWENSPRYAQTVANMVALAVTACAEACPRRLSRSIFRLVDLVLLLYPVVPEVMHVERDWSC